MPSSTKKFVESSRVSNSGGAGGEPSGESPGVPGMTYEIGGGSPDLGL
jgi:hypothetical protein